MVRRTILMFVVLASCATMAPAQVPPGSLGAGDPLPPPLAPDGTAAQAGVPDAGVPDGAAANETPGDVDFRAARARFTDGDREGARVALTAFVARYPDHGSRPAAEILLGRLALLRGDAAAARKLLAPLVDAPTATASAPGAPGGVPGARYYLGLAEARGGSPTRARELLTPYLPRQPGDGSDESLVELRGALAEAAAGTGDAVLALDLWDGFFRGAKEFERAYARQRAEQLGGQLSGEAAWKAFTGAPAKGMARAVLGARAATYLRAQADTSGASLIDSETARARHAMGFEETPESSSPGDPTRIGVALPLSGRFQPIGDAAMRAVLLALGASPSGSSAPQLVVRDTATDPDRAARSVSELGRGEAVIGLIGTAERKIAAAAVAQASQEGVPLLTLDDQTPGASTTAFQLVHAPEARVAELARRALKLGAREIAILGPDSAFGKRMREAFRREIVAGGGRITGEGTYVAGATSFSAAVSAIKKIPPQAIFVADAADRLELIAPALAVADLWPQPWGKPRPPPEPGKPRIRNVLLLSTANDLSPRLLQNAGRYVQGALLSPGFFADDQDPRSRAFVEAYRAAYGQDPRATEAYAYDGVALLRSVTAHGARTRADVLRALAAGGFEGLTGTLQFGVDHTRVDPPLIYVVDGDEIKAAR